MVAEDPFSSSLVLQVMDTLINDGTNLIDTHDSDWDISSWNCWTWSLIVTQTMVTVMEALIIS